MFMEFFVEYISLDSQPYYADCRPLAEGLGFLLVELRVTRRGADTHVSAVITKPVASAQTDTEQPRNAYMSVSVDDCAQVHRLLLPRLEALLNTDNISMDVSSPGMERTIKNAAEFALFAGRPVRLWHTAVKDWIYGMITESGDAALSIRPLESAEQAGSAVQTIPYTEIAKAKLLHL